MIHAPDRPEDDAFRTPLSDAKPALLMMEISKRMMEYEKKTTALEVLTAILVDQMGGSVTYGESDMVEGTLRIKTTDNCVTVSLDRTSPNE